MRSSLLMLAALGVAHAAVVPADPDTLSSFMAIRSESGNTAGISLSLQFSGGQSLDPDKAWVYARSHAGSLLIKHGRNRQGRQSGALLEKRQSSPLLTVAGNGAYFVQVSVGTPAQTFLVVLDSGSDDTWIMDRTCAKECDGHAKFNHSASSTYTASTIPLTLQYGAGSVQGKLATDVVGVAGYEIPKQSFLLVDQLEQDFADSIGAASGFMGLPLAVKGAQAGTPFWHALARTGKIASPLFTLQLKRQKWDLDALASKEFKLLPGGTLTFGVVDDKQFSGPVTYINVTSQDDWEISLDSAKINGKALAFPNTAKGAIVDSGSSFIAGPSSTVDALYAQIPGAQRDTTDALFRDFDLWSLPCDTNARVSLSFGGNEWSIQPEDLIQEPVGKGKDGKEHCVGAFIGLSSGNDHLGSWLIGMPFLKNVFAVFDANFDKGPARVGFAALKA